MDGTGLVCCAAGLGAGRCYTESIKCSSGYCLRMFFSGDHDWACSQLLGRCPLSPGAGMEESSFLEPPLSLSSATSVVNSLVSWEAKDSVCRDRSKEGKGKELILKEGC